MPPRSLAELLFGPRQATGVASVPPSTLKALASPEPPVLTAAPPESKLSQLAGSLRELLSASQGTARGDVGPLWQFLNAPASETWSAAKQQLLDAVASQADNDHRTFLTQPSVVDPNPWMTRAQNELGHVARAGRKALAFTGQVLTPESNLDAAMLGAGKLAAALPFLVGASKADASTAKVIRAYHGSGEIARKGVPVDVLRLDLDPTGRTREIGATIDSMGTWFSSSKDDASHFGRYIDTDNVTRKSPAIVEANVSMSNPKIFESPDDFVSFLKPFWGEREISGFKFGVPPRGDAVERTLREAGHDGIIVKNGGLGDKLPEGGDYLLAFGNKGVDVLGTHFPTK